MKKYSIFIMLMINMIFSNEMLDDFKIDSQISNDLEKQSDLNKTLATPENYGYFKFSTSVLFQQIGYGRRSRNLDNLKGRDWSINARLCLFGINNDGFLPSFKYSFLKYANSSPNSSYWGIGGELIAITEWKGRFDGVLPNIEIFWGKEREKIHFTQFGINLLPAATCLVYSCMGIREMGRGENWASLGALASALIICEFTFGF